MGQLNKRQQGLLLVLNLHQSMPVFSWISQNLISLIRRSIYRQCGIDILMTYFLFRHTVKKNFLEDLNKYHPNINFIHESNKECINFLDLPVSLLDNKVSTELYIKPTDRHQYLHYSSLHPDHTKNTIVYSQILRLYLILQDMFCRGCFCTTQKRNEVVVLETVISR